MTKTARRFDDGLRKRGPSFLTTLDNSDDRLAEPEDGETTSAVTAADSDEDRQLINADNDAAIEEEDDELNEEEDVEDSAKAQSNHAKRRIQVASYRW
jgi:hypothetical protein